MSAQVQQTLQEVYILATGHAANASELAVLEGMVSEGGGYKVVASPGGQFQPAKPRIQSEEKPGTKGTDLTVLHIRNFLDCVKTRQRPHCDIETGHRSTTFALLANMALATRSLRAGMAYMEAGRPLRRS